MEYLGSWGTLIHEKNLKSKISCQTPFKSQAGWKLGSLAKSGRTCGHWSGLVQYTGDPNKICFV
jgi:hypothetical protein